MRVLLSATRALLFCSGNLLGQGTPQRTELSGAASCSTCSIRLEPVVTLGKATDSLFISAIARPVAISGGRFLAKGLDRGAVLLFDQNGQLLQRIGRFGQGPGEFSAVSAIVKGPGDSIAVADAGKVTWLTPTFEYVRSVPWPRGSGPGESLLVLPDSRLMTSLRGDRALGKSVALIFGGSSEPIFVPRPEGSDSGCTYCFLRHTAVGSGNTFWTMGPYQFVIELWSNPAQPSRIFVVDVPQSRLFPQATQQRQQAQFVGLSERASGDLLIVGTAVTDPTAPGAPQQITMTRPSFNRNSPPTALLAAELKARDSFLAIVDTASGIIAASLLPQITLGLAGGDLLYSRSVDPDGVISLHIWRATIVRP